MLRITKKDWSNQDKVIARQESLIQSYLKLTRRTSLPLNKQYWSMCGRCADEQGNLINNCEFDQLVKSKFIQPDQWHGVEKLEEIAKNNLKLKSGNWYHGDFINKFLEYSKDVGFVNYDHHKGYKEAFKGIDYILENIPNDCLVVVNMVKKCGRYKSDINDIAENLIKRCHKYPLISEIYVYNGTASKRATEMASFYFYKE